MNKYPCVYMRGGTSKAVFFKKSDLPEDRSRWKDIFLKVMGSPDAKQIDGMGGTVSSTSKIAVISRSIRENADIDYYFVQVDVERANVSDNLNCGNISSAVGPYSIDEGLVRAVYPITTVRIFNENTGKLIESYIRTEDGRAAVYGDTQIDGVPGTGSEIDLFFDHPGGAATGRTFPTGNKIDLLTIPGFGTIEASLVDISNAGVFVRAADLGLKGAELTEFSQDKALLDLLEDIRCVAAVKIGMAKSLEEAKTECTASPKIGILSPPQDYISLSGKMIYASDMDICCRMISLGALHKSYPMTYAVGTGASAMISGTIPWEMVRPSHGANRVVIGHSSGLTPVNAIVRGDEVEKAGIIRTARRIMDGFVYIRP
ncbi:MAG: PrpF protein [Anaerolineaceae bacterium]|nr:PrpF protein [Anaerolineaceae bacterium]